MSRAPGPLMYAGFEYGNFDVRFFFFFLLLIPAVLSLVLILSVYRCNCVALSLLSASGVQSKPGTLAQLRLEGMQRHVNLLS